MIEPVRRVVSRALSTALRTSVSDEERSAGCSRHRLAPGGEPGDGAGIPVRAGRV